MARELVGRLDVGERGFQLAAARRVSGREGVARRDLARRVELQQLLRQVLSRRARTRVLGARPLLRAQPRQRRPVLARARRSG